MTTSEKLNFAVLAGYVTKINTDETFEVTVFSENRTTIFCMLKSKARTVPFKYGDGIVVRGHLLENKIKNDKLPFFISVNQVKFAETYEEEIKFFELNVKRIKNNNYFKLTGTIEQLHEKFDNIRETVLTLNAISNIDVIFKHGYVDALIKTGQHDIINRHIYVYGKLKNNQLVVSDFNYL